MNKKRKRRTRPPLRESTPREAGAGDGTSPDTSAAVGAENEAGETGDDTIATNVRRTRRLRHPLWIHPDVQERLERHPALYRRLGLIIEQLAARGRSSVVKGCRGANQGWQRAPLGGTGGSQYYLWWTTAGTCQGRQCGLPHDAIAIRAARHHDDHDELHPRSAGDYLEVAQAADIDATVAGSPWTDAQARFREASTPVRVLEGRPGSGKTTALWHSVDARQDAHVLYVTWSSALAEDAEAHFDSFAAPGVRTTCIDYRTLLSELIGEPAGRIPLRESVRRFEYRLGQIDLSIAGAWAREPRAIHAEIRGFLLGGAAGANSVSTAVQDNCLRLTAEAYRRRWAQVGRIDERSIRTLLRTTERLPPGTLEEAFPELAAAHGALRRLEDGDPLPGAYADVDRVVVDEAQDLTLTETAVIAQLCRRIGETRGAMPRVLMAGDEGQTVRPSGFAWARTRALLDLTVGRPATYVLDAQVRCPVAIQKACESIENYYREIEKTARPGGQHKTWPAGTGDGRLMRTRLGKAEQVDAIDALTKLPATAVVAATAEIPEWIPERLRPQILTPAEAKGLEYQTVCVVNLHRGCTVAARGTAAMSDLRLNNEMRRNAIDQARVALSRSTDTLVLVETEDERKQSSWLEYTGVEYRPSDIVEQIGNDCATPYERAIALIDESRTLRQENIERALMRGRQALDLVGRGDDMGRVTEPAQRHEIADSVLETVCTALLENEWSDEHRTGVRAIGTLAIDQKNPEGEEKGKPIAEQDEAPDSETIKDRFEGIERRLSEHEMLNALTAWTRGDAKGGVTAIDQLSLLQGRNGETGTWADGPVRRHKARLTRLIEKGAQSQSALLYRKPLVQSWLEAIRIQEPEKKAEELAGIAFDWIMKSTPRRGADRENDRSLNCAEGILATLKPDAEREARVEEAENRAHEALRLYRRAGATADEQRVIIENALWEEAERSLEKEAHADRRWLLELEGLTRRMPEGIGRRVSERDIERATSTSTASLVRELAEPPAKRQWNGGPGEREANRETHA